MRLKRVSVKGLFGLFDHDIAFTDGENVAIIHGPNGFGKTVMLRMIGDLSSGQSHIFERIPFSEFWLEFDDGSRRAAIRKCSSDPLKSSVTFRHILCDGTFEEAKSPAPLPKEVLDVIDRYIPSRLSRYKDGWRDGRGQSFSLTDVLRRYPRVRERLPSKYLSQIESFAIKNFKVFFVETNRLLASQEVTGSLRDRRLF